MSEFIILVLISLLITVSSLYLKNIYLQKKKFDINENKKFNVNESYKKGLEFENEVYEEIKRVYPNAKVLRNVIIPKNDGNTTEIDILYLTPKGFFVIECKNIQAFIVGREFNDNWLVYYTKKYKQNLYSPIKQNNGHILALKELFPKYNFYNLVIFSDHTKLCKELEEINHIVTKFSGFAEFLIDTLRKKSPIYTQAEVDSIYNFLLSYVDKDKEEHMEYVKKINQKESM